ncbi:hypothetical protein WJX81_002558 [Elliptochloris bilobata]|uniref:Malic enzyme n=1 Tax=Elliptochloris bilobata TaxID=381761 RepID=A0AAW1S8B6_9CHLO
MNNRRQTLAAMSPAALNSRASLGPTRVTKDGKAASKGAGLAAGPTLAGSARPPANNAPIRMAHSGGVQRRSSTYAKPGGPKSDPRPVSDKAYQANCIRVLIAYLSTHGYDQPLAPKLLTSPMSKDVTSIVQFLMRQVDPNLAAKSMGKIEDDVPALFKRLRYPFGISKSALFAIGSPHTWPGLLAALTWLVELLNYKEKAEVARAEGFDGRLRPESEFFDYVARAYRCFLAGDDPGAEAADAEQVAAFDARSADVVERNRRLEQEAQELRERIEAMRTAPSALETARARREEHAADRAKFEQLLDNLQGHKAALARKLGERQADVRAKQEQLAAVEQETAELRARVAAQTVNREDVVRMTTERQKQAGLLASVTAQREAADRRVAEAELGCETRLDDLEALLQEYHTTADRLQLIPASAKRAGGVQFEIALDRAGASAAEMVSVDVKGTIKGALGRVREGAAARGRELGEEALALQERLDAARHTAAERVEDAAVLQEHVGKLEAQFAAGKAALEADVRAAGEAAEALRAEVAQLRGATRERLAFSEERVAAAEAAARSAEADAERLNRDLSEALGRLVDHKLHVQRSLEAVLAHMRAVGFCKPGFAFQPSTETAEVDIVRNAGVDLLHDPLHNKGTAFPSSERERLQLRGLLPPRVLSMEAQIERFMDDYTYGKSYLDPEHVKDGGVTHEHVRRWKVLQELQDRNETLFYKILLDNFPEMAPIVYTPTVGWACLNYHLLFRRPRGMYFSATDKGEIASVVWNWPSHEVDAIVVTDGSRILGLGDLGLNGLGISIGKLDLYVAAAGFNPARVLPIVLDVGTNNERLRNDPLYMGLKHPRIEGDAYYEIVDELVRAIFGRFPNTVLQFEDFNMAHAAPLLERYRYTHLVFNDDIQGTATCAVGGVYGAMAVQGKTPEAITQQKFAVLGAGSAGMGVVCMLAKGMVKHGLTPEQAAERFYILDADGLITRKRGAALPDNVRPYARQEEDLEGLKLEEVVKHGKPTGLIGLSGAGRLFTENVLRAMGEINEQPIIMPMSNPTHRMECTAEDAQRMTGGRAIFASGSPQPDVEVEDRVIASCQANNLFVFPAIALAAHLGQTKVITDHMLMAAAEALPLTIKDEDLKRGCVYPSLHDIRDISVKLAREVLKQAAKEGHLGNMEAERVMKKGDKALEQWIAEHQYVPGYRPLVHLPTGVLE